MPDSPAGLRIIRAQVYRDLFRRRQFAARDACQHESSAHRRRSPEFCEAEIDVGGGVLLALNSTTLATRASVALIDPNLGGLARLSDDGTATPVVGPDGRVFYGVLERTFGTHNARGWLLQFDASLNPVGVPGSFGWDVSPSVIPASMVPSYAGTSTYLLAQKYNLSLIHI